jgi:hypothetical protein
MKNICGFFSIIIMIPMITFLTNCVRDNGSSQNKIQNLMGYAQKGPFINGSSVTVFDLQSDLSPTGKSFNSQITDNKGTFQLSDIPLSSNYVSLRADGFYFNEISGRQSTAQITLYALSDISEKTNINVNILTDMERSRVEYLMKQGKSFTDSKVQAQKEILGIFNIEKSDIKTSENLDISENGDDNGILLAISSILQGYRSESELTELLSNIKNDIKEDGILNSSTLGSDLINHAIILDTVSIKHNLVKRFNDLGAPGNIPNFSKYIANFISKTKFEITGDNISYPENGLNGDNILSLSKTTYHGGLDIYHSLAAQLADGTPLKIKITSLSSGKSSTSLADSINPVAMPVWYYSPETNTNWSISIFDNTNYTQTFTAVESNKSCDLRMSFEKGSFLLEYFEMGATLPTRRKTIMCN